MELAMYVTLFLSLYFQVFAILTFVSRSARERRCVDGVCNDYPTAAVIVPCYNEGTTIGGTVESLKALDYPRDKFEIILVNDGSTDNTRAVMDSYLGDPQITVIHKENGGKHTGLNLGIARTTAEFVGCLDADSFVHPQALKQVLAHFDDPCVAAVTSSMTVHNPKNILERMQYAEYLIGVALRHIMASVNGLYVTPGPFSFYRKSILDKVGGFRHAHQTEDMEMAMRLQKLGYTIGNAPRAQVYTKAPRTVRALIKQRTRWTTGFLRNSYDYRALIGNPRYGVLGLMVLPLGLTAILAGMGMFAWTIIDMTKMVANAIAVQGEVPLTYALTAHPVDWFYMPITGVMILALVGISIVVTTMAIGKKISGAEGTIGTDIFWYLSLYSLIAPLWLFRATRDVALGTTRAWK